MTRNRPRPVLRALVAVRRLLRPRSWGLATSVLGSVIGLLLTAMLVLLGGWFALGRPALPTEFEDAGETFEAVRIGLYLVAGLGAAVGLTVSYRKQRGEEEGAFTARYTSAAEQLGNSMAAVRLAGVYALARLADDWEDQRQICIDVLCAYLRMPYEPDAAPQGEREVRLTVIRIIRQHLVGGAPTSWQGRDFDFTGATLDGGDFSDSMFSAGEVSFRNARFIGDSVRFIGANFTGGSVSFYRATIITGIDFERAVFSGAARVNFNDATINGYVDFRHTTFSSGAVDFYMTKFSGGIVEFTGATFSGGHVEFASAYFEGGKVDFQFVHDWSVPPRNLPPGEIRGLILPARRRGNQPINVEHREDSAGDQCPVLGSKQGDNVDDRRDSGGSLP